VLQNDPLQLTLDSCKLSILPCPSGPVIEFTDYLTDITWLSGRIYLNATGDANYLCSHIALNDPSWHADEHEVHINGTAGDLAVELSYSLSSMPGIENSVYMKERIRITNPGSKPVAFERFRLGPTWSPPKSWWVYWGYWRLLKIDDNFDPSVEPPDSPGEKLNDIRDRLKKVMKARGKLPVPIGYGPDASGWIFCDNKRFLLVLKESTETDEVCLLDILQDKPVPAFIMGGIGNVIENSGWPRQLNPGKSWTSGTTTFIPGSGGWDRAFETYTKFRD